MVRYSNAIASLALCALATGSMGCELVADIDRTEINRGGKGGDAGQGGQGGGAGQGGQGGEAGQGGQGGGMVDVCGDGTVASGEACDDGNVAAGDGCAADCTVEAGYSCTGAPSVCSNVDDCASMPCQNGGTCTDGVNSYTCMCATGYSGTNCETDIDECTLNTDNCDTNATCSNTMGSFTCACNAGYNGNGVMCVLAGPETNCNDGVDNNLNGQIDGADADCAVPAYFPPCSAGETFLVFAGSGLPLAIPDDPTEAISPLTVTGASTNIARAAVLFDVNHTYASEVIVRLTRPSGPDLQLLYASAGGSGDNFTNTVFDSTCATGVNSGAAPFTGCFAPGMDSLAPLTGTSANGAWSLKLADYGFFADTGTLTSWKLLLCLQAP